LAGGFWHFYGVYGDFEQKARTILQDSPLFGRGIRIRTLNEGARG